MSPFEFVYGKSENPNSISDLVPLPLKACVRAVKLKKW